MTLSKPFIIVTSVQNSNQANKKIKTVPSQSYEETAPMDTIGTDLFSYAGKDYLIIIERFSGFVM